MMDKDLQAAIWDFVKTRRDNLTVAVHELEEAQALLNMMNAAGLSDHLPTAKEIKGAYIEVNSPFERVPVCACDPGTGPPPTAAEMKECWLRGGRCRESNETEEAVE